MARFGDFVNSIRDHRDTPPRVRRWLDAGCRITVLGVFDVKPAGMMLIRFRHGPSAPRYLWVFHRFELKVFDCEIARDIPWHLWSGPARAFPEQARLDARVAMRLQLKARRDRAEMFKSPRPV
jgi:hypothetical protein